jgi:hypothetical protein
VIDWTGPHASDLKIDGLTLIGPVPVERWPHGPPDMHQDGCKLMRMYDKDRVGNLYCDCLASAADDNEYGYCSWPTVTPHPDEKL